MGFVVKNSTSIYLKEESTEGVYVAPSASDAIEVLSDGAGFEYTKEEVTRNLLTSTIEVVASRVGMASVSGNVPVEYKAGSVEGAYPREKVLYKSLLGGARQITTNTTTKTGNTATVLQIQDADISKFHKGDIIVVKQSGAYEARPISAVTTTLGSASITLAIALTSAPADNVVISKSTVYYHADGAPTFSATQYLGGTIKEEVSGCRSISASLESWEGGAVANFNFSVEGLDLIQSDENLPSPLTPSFVGDALPPVILNACVWIDGVKVAYNSLSLSLENTKAEILSACAASGKSGSRFTQFVCSGEIAPYMEDNNVDRFTSFNNNDSISIFGYAYNPTSTVGQIEQVVAFWVPQAKITSMPNGDQDGIMTNQISFKAYRVDGSDTVFLGFI